MREKFLRFYRREWPALADKNSPYPFTEKQLGPYLTRTPKGAAGGTTA